MQSQRITDVFVANIQAENLTLPSTLASRYVTP